MGQGKFNPWLTGYLARHQDPGHARVVKVLIALGRAARDELEHKVKEMEKPTIADGTKALLMIEIRREWQTVQDVRAALKLLQRRYPQAAKVEAQMTRPGHEPVDPANLAPWQKQLGQFL